MNCFAGGGGFARGVENFGDDHIRLERRRAFDLFPIEDDCSEIRNGIVIRRGERSGRDLLLLMVSLTADENGVALNRLDVSGLTVDLNVLHAEWPVPRGLDDGLRL